ncbi:MAG: class I SAM-dependent methyltransferase, partial [Candidatus Dormibacteraceae bacterium]
YDTDPGRWASMDRRWLMRGDTHEEVASRIVAGGERPVLDVGSGTGRLRACLPKGWGWVGVDASPTQLLGDRTGTGRVAQAEAARLPFPSGCFAAVAALWMLYHLEDPSVAVGEAWRVLRAGGTFYACAASRRNDPELTSNYPATTFDAEEAPEIVASVFGGAATSVVRWDGPFVQLGDNAALATYRRSHHLRPGAGDGLDLPLTLTKRGCLVIARRQESP